MNNKKTNLITEVAILKEGAKDLKLETETRRKEIEIIRDDHEKRIRYLERVVFMAWGGLAVLNILLIVLTIWSFFKH